MRSEKVIGFVLDVEAFVKEELNRKYPSHAFVSFHSLQLIFEV